MIVFFEFNSISAQQNQTTALPPCSLHQNKIFILTAIFHPISAFDVGCQPEKMSPIARLPAGLYYSILLTRILGDWF
jgi:hypothetical protein